MRAASFLLAPDQRPVPLRQRLPRRAVAFLVVLAVHVLLMIVLFVLAPPTPVPKGQSKVFELRQLPEPAVEPAPVPAPRAKRRQAAAKPKGAAPAAPVAPPTPTPPSELFGTELFEAVDIAKLPNQRELRAAGEAEGEDKGESAGTASAGDSVLVGGAGGGPNGEPMYQAEWQREPTDAELSFYMRGAPANSWGIIACKTAARYRVEDCQELADSPPGSRLAGALREAAWQFRVLPPRVGGKQVIGAWVRIRIDFSERPAR